MTFGLFSCFNSCNGLRLLGPLWINVVNSGCPSRLSLVNPVIVVSSLNLSLGISQSLVHLLDGLRLLFIRQLIIIVDSLAFGCCYLFQSLAGSWLGRTLRINSINSLNPIAVGLSQGRVGMVLVNGSFSRCLGSIYLTQGIGLFFGC